jgi:hypothetical protein
MTKRKDADHEPARIAAKGLTEPNPTAASFTRLYREQPTKQSLRQYRNQRPVISVDGLTGADLQDSLREDAIREIEGLETHYRDDEIIRDALANARRAIAGRLTPMSSGSGAKPVK